MTWLGYSHKGVAKRLNVATQPAGAVAATALTTQPVIELLDGASLPASTSGVSVAVVKHSGVVGTLSGTSPRVTASNGRATFTDLAMSAAESGVSLDFSASGLTGVTSSPFTVASAGGPPADALFYSDWSTGTGTGDAAVRDTGKTTPWTQTGGGTQTLAVVPATGFGFPAGMTNLLRNAHITGTTFYWLAANNIWSAPTTGNSLYFRVYWRSEVSNALTAAAYASTHPMESEGGLGSVNGNYYAMHYGSWGDGTTPWYIAIDAMTRQFTPGGPGGANPSNLNKFVTYRFEWQYTKTGTTAYTMHLRIYDGSETLVYSDADGLNNMYVWGGGLMSAANTNLQLDDAHVADIRFGVNGGFDPGGNGTQYVYWGGFAVRTNDWCGPYSNGF